MIRTVIRSIAVAAFIGSAVGCSTKTPAVTNPFAADRVPPPTFVGGAPAGGPPAYYPGAQGAPPVQGVAPAYQGAAPLAPSGYPTAPGPAPTTAPGSATPFYGAPPVGGSASRSRPSNSAIAGSGDAVAVPTDAGSLRFSSPRQTALARSETQPVRRSDATLLASNGSTRRPATANAWISGSAPIRPASPADGPRVRMPGDFGREPVSIAALDRSGGVPIAPLEPTGSPAQPGQGAPLRVATPTAGTGWR